MTILARISTETSTFGIFVGSNDSPFVNASDKILLEIFENLNVLELLRTAQTCKKFYKMITQETSLVRKLCAAEAALLGCTLSEEITFDSEDMLPLDEAILLAPKIAKFDAGRALLYTSKIPDVRKRINALVGVFHATWGQAQSRLATQQTTSTTREIPSQVEAVRNAVAAFLSATGKATDVDADTFCSFVPILWTGNHAQRAEGQTLKDRLTNNASRDVVFSEEALLFPEKALENIARITNSFTRIEAAIKILENVPEYPSCAELVARCRSLDGQNPSLRVKEHLSRLADSAQNRSRQKLPATQEGLLDEAALSREFDAVANDHSDDNVHKVVMLNLRFGSGGNIYPIFKRTLEFIQTWSSPHEQTTAILNIAFNFIS